MNRPPAKCNRRQVRRVAWVRPRADYCYECLPGGPFEPPPCRRCGSARYFGEGLCDACHPGAPAHVGSCRGCLAWGVYRTHSWRCWSCRWWHTHYPGGNCQYCGRDTTVGDGGSCRLCLEQARIHQQPGRAPDLAAANQYGQQLFLANMRFQRPRTPRLEPAPKRRGHAPPPKGFKPTQWRQVTLFDLDRDAEIVSARSLVADSDLISYCKHVVGDHSARHGWSKRQRNDVIRSLRLLDVLQDTPGALINTTDVMQLPRYSGNITSTLEVLAAAGLRSLFKVLKDRKLTFVNPNRALRSTPVNSSVPLPPDTAAIRQALDSPDPAAAFAVALVAFHALTARQLAGLKLTDIVDSRLRLDGRDIPPAGPVRVRLAAWLDHRARTWPDSANPHLFINKNSGPRLTPVGRQFPWRNTNLRPQALREDRILAEIHATGGDIRRICDLFGVTISTAMRYAATLEPPASSSRIDRQSSKRVD